MKKLICLVLAVCVLAAPVAVQGQTRLEIGDYILLGKYYDQPILWRCMDIDENGPLMLTLELCEKEFDSRGQEGSNIRRYWGISNYWGDSNIRSWLNSSAPAGEVVWLSGNSSNFYRDEKGFLADGNFTETERSVIKSVTQKSLLDPLDAELAVGGDAEAWGSMSNGSFNNSSIDLKEFVENRYDEICYEYVTDKVFLLDAKQWVNITENEEILGESFNIFKPDDSFGKCYVGLRTPYGWRYIYSGQGGGYPSGDRIMFPCFESYDNTWGARIVEAGDEATISPAFYLNESTAQILSGSGTEEDPYVVDGKQIAAYVNGTELTLDVPPMLENDRTLVPMRAIFEALGAEVS